ncbi:MAG: hypothetical protein MUE54_10615 [Anaerolineae bacterium]|nr:hypothetical protein [Anaerolineae bacterium]
MRSRLLALCIIVCATFGILSAVSAAPVVGLGNLTDSGEGSFAQITDNTHSAIIFLTKSDTRTITDFKMRYILPEATPNINITVALYLSDSANTRGAFVGTIGINNYTSLLLTTETTIFTPATTITLTPNTYYWLEIRGDADFDFSWMSRNPRIAPSGLFTYIETMRTLNGGATWTVGSNPPFSFELAVEVDTPVVPVVPVVPVISVPLSPDTTALGCTLTSDVAMTGAPDNTYCRLLMKNGGVVNYAGAVPQNLINLGVILAVDVYRLQGGQSLTDFGGYNRICLAGQGRLFYLDARTSPRVQTELATEIVDGFTCGWIPAVGTVVLTN